MPRAVPGRRQDDRRGIQLRLPTPDNSYWRAAGPLPLPLWVRPVETDTAGIPAVVAADGGAARLRLASDATAALLAVVDLPPLPPRRDDFSPPHRGAGRSVLSPPAAGVARCWAPAYPRMGIVRVPKPLRITDDGVVRLDQQRPALGRHRAQVDPPRRSERGHLEELEPFRVPGLPGLEGDVAPAVLGHHLEPRPPRPAPAPSGL